MLDFAAIDFETANPDGDSACAVGVAIVSKGAVSHSLHTLIKPRGEFSRWCTAVHRITADDVADQPTFDQVWPQLCQGIGQLPLVSHNANFDMRVLDASLRGYGLEIPNRRWLCTLQLSRAVLPGLPNHRLSTLASLFGLQLKHHEAASDAIACAEIALRLLRILGDQQVETFCREFPDAGIGGDVEADEYEYTGSTSEPERIISVAKSSGRLQGLRFVFTGELNWASRSDVESIVVSQGADVSGSVSRKTDYVVVGDEVMQRYREGLEVTGKLAKAAEIIRVGGKVRVIGESEFLAMVQ